MPKDSINRNQPEENRRHLRAGAAMEKIKELAEEAKTCFFCTAVASGESSGSRPMNVVRWTARGTCGS